MVNAFITQLPYCYKWKKISRIITLMVYWAISVHPVANNSVQIGDPNVLPLPKFSQHYYRITLSFYQISSAVQRGHWAMQTIVFHCHKLQLQQYGFSNKNYIISV